MKLIFAEFLMGLVFGVLFLGNVSAQDLELSLVTPFQTTSESAGVTTATPLLIMPCKGATKQQHPGDGDFFLILKNISKRSVAISMRETTPVTLTFFTPNGTVVANKWLPKEYSVHYSIPPCPGSVQFIYTLKPGEIHIYPINLFNIQKLVDEPLDWMAVYNTEKVRLEYTAQYYPDNNRSTLQSGWIPIAVHEPEADTHGDAHEGDAIEAIPSSKPGEPPVFKVHPQGTF